MKNYITQLLALTLGFLMAIAIGEPLLQQKAQAQALGGFNDPFISYQLATTSLTNGYVLQTDGTDSTWVATSTLGITGDLSTTSPFTAGDVVIVSDSSTITSSSTLSSSLIEDAYLLNTGDTGTGAYTFTGTVNLDGNVDFNNQFRLSTEAEGGVNRLLLQGVGANSDSELFLQAKGSSDVARITLSADENTNNYEFIEIDSNGTNHHINSSSTGSGTTLPFSLQMNDNNVIEIATDNSIDLAQLTTNGFLTTSGGDGSVSVQSTIDISDDTNLSAGTNITLSGDTLNVDDAFLSNAGDTTTGDLIFNDNVKALFGTGSDASIYYDGTDFQFDSQEVGSGDFIFNNGNVGIGTTSPSAKLTVTGGDILANANDATLTLGDPSNGSGQTNITLARGGVQASEIEWTRQNTVDARIQMDANEDFYVSNLFGGDILLDTTGNVGIGTTVPNEKLHISDTTEATLRFESTSTGLSGGDSIGDIEWEANDVTTGSSGVVGRIRYLAEDLTPEYAMSFWTHDNLLGTPDFAERMRITSSGNVGIGDTSPASLLTVGSGDLFQVDSSGNISSTGTLSIDGTGDSYIQGNVGIGTTGPGAKLHVSDAVNNSATDITSETSGLTVENTNATAGSRQYLRFAGATAGDGAFIRGIYNANNDNDLQFGNYTNAPANNVSMTILNSGNVGIGTTSPGAKLNIVDTASVSSYTELLRLGTTGTAADASWGIDFRGYVNGNNWNTGRIATVRDSTFDNFSLAFSTYGATDTLTEKMRVDPDGNVGIGTTTPVGKFHVVTGTSGVSSGLSTMENGSISFSNGASSNAVPTMIGRSNDSIGLFLEGGTNNSNTLGDVVFNVRENDNTDFATLTTPAFKFSRYTTDLVTILRNGNVGIGTTSPAYKLVVENSSEGDTFQLVDTDGDCLQDPDSGSITTTCTSDAKFKENVRDTSFEGLNHLINYQLRDYEVKKTGETRLGVVAQEIEQVYPERVKDVVRTKTEKVEVGKDDAGEPVYEDQVSTSSSKYVQLPTVWELLKAIQELFSWNTAQDTRLDALEAENEALKARLRELEK